MQNSEITQPSINKIVNLFQGEIKKIYQDELKQLILYGSQARGDAKPDSDIDILVILKDGNNNQNKYEKVIQLISDLCLEYDTLISCVFVSENQFMTEKSPLLINIYREGIKL